MLYSTELNFFLFILFIQSARMQNFMTGDNSTVIGCSSHCSYNDYDLSCWNTTLHFFERILLGQMRHYISVQINIDQWRRRREKTYISDFENQKQLSINFMESFLQHDDLINKTTIEDVVGILMDLVANKFNKTISFAPHFSCPIPCEYRYFAWRNLFIASLILNICMFLALFPFVKRVSQRGSRETLIIRT